MSQLSLGGLCGIVLSPDALEEQRGAWCSPPEFTEAAGAFDLDPFTNPRSTLVADVMCMLERQDDGFGHVVIPRPRKGSYASSGDPGLWFTTEGGYGRAHAGTRVWIQPPYDIVLQVLAHYGHTRFTALLRLDTSTLWFDQLWQLSEVIMVPKRDRLAFVPPPGVDESSNPFPHGLYYKRAADVPAAISALCYPWPSPAYPWASDPLGISHSVTMRRLDVACRILVERFEDGVDVEHDDECDGDRESCECPQIAAFNEIARITSPHG